MPTPESHGMSLVKPKAPATPSFALPKADNVRTALSDAATGLTLSEPQALPATKWEDLSDKPPVGAAMARSTDPSDYHPVPTADIGRARSSDPSDYHSIPPKSPAVPNPAPNPPVAKSAPTGPAYDFSDMFPKQKWQDLGAGSPPDKGSEDWLGGIGKWLGDNAPKFAEGLGATLGGIADRFGRGFANAGGSGQYGREYQNMQQNLQRELQMNDIGRQLVMQGRQNQATYGPSGNSVGQYYQTLPGEMAKPWNQTGAEANLYKQNMNTYFNNLPNYMNMLNKLYGGAGFGGGNGTSAGAWANNPDYNSLLNPGALSNPSINPQQDFGNQMRQMEFGRSLLGAGPGMPK